MDKNAIKKYATWARRELISRVSQKAAYYEITEEHPGKVGEDHIGGRVLTAVEKNQRDALIRCIQREGYEQVMEEVAYTWFNRFCALRYMEVNNYLPTHIRVFTDEEGAFKPQILTESINLELDGLDMEKVYAYKDANEQEQLYRYLLITQCNALSSILPGMFQKIEDYTELLLPENLLREGSVIEQMVTLIPEEDWTDQVQIIGWLYQYYNAEKKDEVFAALKKNVKITKENIPAATQLFTPDWIVRYMVENSLGRLWVEGHLNDELKAGWKYYLDEAEQEPEVQAQLAEIRREYSTLNPQDIRCIDPCMGSGHILVYMFDVLVQIYEAYGYSARDAARSIVEHNLYGLDIDERSAQLAYFSVMMKARSYDRRFFSRGSAPKVYAIRESNGVDASALEYFVNGNPTLKAAMNSIMEDMHDAREYGSIIHVRAVDFAAIYARFDEIADDIHISARYCLDELLPLVQVAETLAQKYQVVCTNPPYMGGSGMGAKLGKYVKDNYPDSKSDLFAVFIERCGEMTAKNGYQAMITQHAWMFLSSFEKLRSKLLQKDTVNMTHLGARAFEEIGGEVVQTTSFVLCNSHIADYKGTYCRLIEPTTQQGKEDMFLSGENRFAAQQSNFAKIPGSSVAYWVPVNVLNQFAEDKVGNHFNARVGLLTTNNDKFLRFFWEVSFDRICFNACDNFSAKESHKKWFPHNKGGSFRKWAGNQEYVVDWENNGQRIKETAVAKYPYLNGNPNFVVHDDGYYFHENISWSEIALSKLAFRYFPEGFTFNVKGMSAFSVEGSDLMQILAYANSNVANYFAKIINPSISFGVNSFNNLPYQSGNEDVSIIAEENVALSKTDWDAFETSWDFQQHPLVRLSRYLSDATSVAATMSHYYGGHPKVDSPVELCYLLWQGECKERFDQLKANEEELNRIFIDIYGLQDELTPDVENKDVTVRLADKTRDVKSLISYAVGCMFGRYSLDREGLIYAGGEWDERRYTIFPADKDNIIPICDDEYFTDDIVGRFVEFIKTVYGEAKLDENLKFIADALGGKGQPKEVIRNYFLNDFYADHLKIYQKRPIYWLFDSGRKNGFKCLIYMHRYRPDTIARIRTDYVHEQQARYRTAIADLEHRVANAAASERVKLNKQLTKLQAQADELREYEEKIHHLADQMIAIDLDDGVKKNYARFQDVLAKIK